MYVYSYKFKQCRNYCAHFKIVRQSDLMIYVCAVITTYVSRKVTEFKQKGTYATINTYTRATYVAQYTYLALAYCQL